MNFFKTSLLCAGLTLSVGTSRAQFIIAGDPVGNYYHDVNPDSLMEALCVHLSPYPPDSVKLDVDSDGVYDFIIQSGADGGLGGGAGGAESQRCTAMRRLSVTSTPQKVVAPHNMSPNWLILFRQEISYPRH